MEPEALRRSARLSQSGAEHDQARLAGRATDPDYIDRVEDFTQLSHHRIHDCVQAMNPGDLRTAADTWVTIADSIFGAVTTLHATIHTALADSMTGRLADAAAAAARRFVQDATDTAEITHSTGHRMIAAAFGAEALRKTVPPPVTHGSRFDRDEQYQLALAALDANYTPIYPPAGSGIPAFFAITAPGESDASGNTGGATDPTPASNPLSDTALGPTSNRYAMGNPADLGEHRPQATDRTTPTNSSAAQPIPQHRSDLGEPAIASGQAADPAADRWSSHSDHDHPSTTADTHPAAIPSSPSPLSTPPVGEPTRPGHPASPVGTPPNRYSPIPFPDPARSFPAPITPEPATQPRPLTPPSRPESPTTAIPPGMFAPAARTPNPDAAHTCPPWLLRNRENELLGTPPPHVRPTLGAEFPSAGIAPAPAPDDHLD
ncbi:PPE domain-containing protein [Nocardia sp. NPDC004582]